MKDQWFAVRSAAAVLNDDGRESVRLANLAITAAIAHRQGLLKLSRADLWSGPVLRDAIEVLALSPLPSYGGDENEWNVLAECADFAASAAGRPDSVDAWVDAAQGADSERKSRGAYATPATLANQVARSALTPFLGARTCPQIIDPSVGAGALLIAAMKFLGEGASASEWRTIVYSLHGVELDPIARELCCHLLWLAAAPGKPELARIAANVVVDNAITRDWAQYDSGQYDALVMNPPWESLRHDAVGEDSTHRAERLATIARLERKTSLNQRHPDLFRSTSALPDLFSAQGTGDRNLFKAFMELAPHLIRSGGTLSALVPAAFASDLGMAQLRRLYFDNLQLDRWTSFENLRRYFPIDGRYKFGILTGKRSALGTTSLAVRGFAVDAEEVDAEHVTVTRDELARVGGRAQMIPEVRTRSEIAVLAQVLEQGTPLFESGSLGMVRYRRELDLTLDREAGHFWRTEECQPFARGRDGQFLLADGRELVPLIEGRMVGQYDFFQKSWIAGKGRTAKWDLNGDRSLPDCLPQYLVPPASPRRNRIAICDVTSATNTRTVLATWVPPTWQCGNTAPVLEFENEEMALAGLAVLNSMIFDWMARRVVAGLHVNKFYLEALAWPRLTPDARSVLTEAARSLRGANPRYAELSATPRNSHRGSADQTTARIQIEKTLASSFRLTPALLIDIYANDRTDRRGLWRHYASDPAAIEIAQAVIAEDAVAMVGCEK